ncbi:putative Sterile alpha motif domain-containing protein [Naja naja]|nr:putative Sterile alpha motif domain-containing protein [Naja naja]
MRARNGGKACLEATLSVCKARLLLLEPEPLLPPLGVSFLFSCFCRRDYQGEIAVLFFLVGCKAAMNSARTRYVIHILPVLRGQIEVAKRMGRVLCMPTFPVASPVQPADCNLPPAELRPTFHSEALSPYRALLSSRVSPSRKMGPLSLEGSG